MACKGLKQSCHLQPGRYTCCGSAAPSSGHIHAQVPCCTCNAAWHAQVSMSKQRASGPSHSVYESRQQECARTLYLVMKNSCVTRSPTYTMFAGQQGKVLLTVKCVIKGIDPAA